MKLTTRPKLLPVLISLGVVGLFAATLPYPGFQPSVNVLPPEGANREASAR